MQNILGKSTSLSAEALRPLFSASTPSVSGRSIFSVMSVSGIEVETRIIDDMFRLARRSGNLGGGPLTLTSSVMEQMVENLTVNVGDIRTGFCKTRGLYRNHALVIMDQGEIFATPDSSFSGSGKVVKRLIPLWNETDTSRQYVFTVNDDYLLHPVGGKIELGETPLSALNREITEELGYFKGFKTIPDFTFQRITHYEPEEWNEIYRLVDWTVLQ